MGERPEHCAAVLQVVVGVVGVEDAVELLELDDFLEQRAASRRGEESAADVRRDGVGVRSRGESARRRTCGEAGRRRSRRCGGREADPS